MTTKQSEQHGWTPEKLGPLGGKTYVITGATSGTGLEATRIFLSRGASVVMLSRNTEKSAAVVEHLRQEFGADAKVSSIRMDLSSLASVRQAAEEVLEKVPHIDALICNAGIAQVPELQKTVDGFESHLGVNYLDNFLLCGLLFERIEQSAGRIVAVSSLGYKMGLKRIQFEDLNFETNYSPRNAYNQSKLALMLFIYELQRRICAANKNAQAFVCHPGASRTSLIDTNASRLDKIVWSILSRIIAQSPEQGAWPEVMCATQEGLKQEAFYGPTRRGETVGPVGECKLYPFALDEEAANRLWKISEEMTGFRWSL